jgi:hypothetical protein
MKTLPACLREVLRRSEAEFQTKILAGLFKVIFVVSLLILSVILEKWQSS